MSGSQYAISLGECFTSISAACARMFSVICDRYIKQVGDLIQDRDNGITVHPSVVFFKSQVVERSPHYGRPIKFHLLGRPDN